MVAVDDRQRPDAPADAGVSGAGVDRLRASAVDVEQRRDDLQIILHPVVVLADQPSLSVERAGHFAFGFIDARHRALEGVAQFLNLGRWPEFAGQLEFFTRAVADDRALQLLEWPNQ